MKKDLLLSPIEVKHGWYYEGGHGLSVVHPSGSDNIVVIPWTKILASVARYKRKAKRKVRSRA